MVSWKIAYAVTLAGIASARPDNSESSEVSSDFAGQSGLVSSGIFPPPGASPSGDASGGVKPPGDFHILPFPLPSSSSATSFATSVLVRRQEESAGAGVESSGGMRTVMPPAVPRETDGSPMSGGMAPSGRPQHNGGAGSAAPFPTGGFSMGNAGAKSSHGAHGQGPSDGARPSGSRPHGPKDSGAPQGNGAGKETNEGEGTTDTKETSDTEDTTEIIERRQAGDNSAFMPPRGPRSTRTVLLGTGIPTFSFIADPTEIPSPDVSNEEPTRSIAFTIHARSSRYPAMPSGKATDSVV